MLCNFLFHHVLQYLQSSLRGFFQSHLLKSTLAYLMEIVFQILLSSFLSGSNCSCLPLDVSARWIGLVQMRTRFINSCHQKCYSIRSRHWLLLCSFRSFAKVDSQVRDWLGDWIDTHWLIESKSMVLTFNPRVINQDPSISNNSTHGTPDVRVKLALDLLTSMIFSKDTGSIKLEGNLRSTASNTPSLVLMPIEVVPNWIRDDQPW